VNGHSEQMAIGGYFALERGVGAGLPWIDEAIGYQSARSALAAALTTLRPSAIWAPNFICGAVNDSLRSIGAQVRRYVLTEALGVPDEVSLAATELLICVDYFGINAAAVDQALDRFGSDNILVDASQSLFFRPRHGGAAVYSPRKFVGIPDGGLLRTARRMPTAHEASEANSIRRSEHLLYRLAGLVDAGFAKFQEAEASLSGCEPVAISRLTDALLRSIDLENVAELRIRNYRHIAGLLHAAGIAAQSLPSGTVPLCLPVKCDDAIQVRSKLVAQRIFTPTYWADAVIPDADHVALKLRDHTVYLPCDQRYGEPELQRIASSMIQAMEAS
jgi:hypothetical protein